MPNFELYFLYVPEKYGCIDHMNCLLADDLYVTYIKTTRWVSFGIKFTRQGFDNAC